MLYDITLLLVRCRQFTLYPSITTNEEKTTTTTKQLVHKMQYSVIESQYLPAENILPNTMSEHVLNSIYHIATLQLIHCVWACNAGICCCRSPLELHASINRSLCNLHMPIIVVNRPLCELPVIIIVDNFSPACVNYGC